MGLPALTPESATIYGAVIAVVGSVIGGFIAAWATLRATKNTLEAETRAQLDQTKEQRQTLLHAVRREFRVNLEIVESPQVDRAFVPFEQYALRSAYNYLASLPDETYAAIQRAQFACGRYNALVSFFNGEGDPPLIAADVYDAGAGFANANNQGRREYSARQAVILANQARQPITEALASLEAVIGKQ